MSLFTRHRESTGETPEQTLARLHAATQGATPVGPTRDQYPLTTGERLAQIPQRRWRLICIACWPCVAIVAFLVFGMLGGFQPNSAQAEPGVVALVVTSAAVLALWALGVQRTREMDSKEVTTIQRVARSTWETGGRAGRDIWEHLGDGF